MKRVEKEEKRRVGVGERERGEAGGAWAGLSDRRKCWSVGLQVNGRRKAPAGCLRQAWALLFYHLGDKSSTDSQLIFNTAQTTRHSAAVHMPTRGEEEIGEGEREGDRRRVDKRTKDDKEEEIQYILSKRNDDFFKIPCLWSC